MREMKHVTAAIALSLCASSASAATLGLATTGPVDTGTGELFYTSELAGFVDLADGGFSTLFFEPTNTIPNVFDSGGDVADITATGTNDQVIEFQLSAFDGYTDGALLLVDVSKAGITGDPLAFITGSTSFFLGDADYSLQGLAPAVQPVPLPGGMLLLGTALAGLGLRARCRAS